MHFYLDENLSQQVAIIARRFGVDVTSAQELDRRGLSDEEQLAFAAAEGRCLVSRDYKDFPRITGVFGEQGLPHRGVLSVSPSLHRRGSAAVAAALVRYDQDHQGGMPDYDLDWLTPAREAS